MKSLKRSRHHPATLLFTALAVALALVLLVMLGQEQRSAGAVAGVAALAALAAGLAFGLRRAVQGGAERPTFWVVWVEQADPGSDRPPRRPVLPYVALFALIYGALVAGSVVLSANTGVRVPMFVYLLFIWGADQVVLRQFAQRAQRPLLREELVSLYSGTALIIVLAELPSILALSRQGAWNSATITFYLLIAALVFGAHYFGLTRLAGGPRR